jgi:hypothetical protein
MSCYFRILADVFREAGIEVNPANKKRVDEAVHRIVGVDYKHCPSTGKAVKEQIRGDQAARQEFVRRLKEELR